VTDHRIGLTLYQLDKVIDGDLTEFIEALALAFQEEQLQEQL
jgi:peptide chain release factor 1